MTPIMSTGDGRDPAMIPDCVHQLFGRHGMQRHLSTGAILAAEGELSDRLHFVKSGWTYRYSVTHEGSRQILGVSLPGDFCNLDGLGTPVLSYGGRTRTAATIISIPYAVVLAAMERSPELTAWFRRLISIENAILGRLTMSIGRQSARSRLAHFICEMTVRLNRTRAGEKRPPFDMPFTQEDLGDILGLTAVHINRTLQTLKNDGVVSMDNHKIRVLDMARLARIADFDALYLGMSGRPDDTATASLSLPVGRPVMHHGMIAG